MCGIFGIVAKSGLVSEADLRAVATHAEQRGRDSSGLVYHSNGKYSVRRADRRITELLGRVTLGEASMVIGHSRLITNGEGDNQPVVRGGLAVLHNGIVVNDLALWEELGLERHQEIDTEVIAAIFSEGVKKGCKPVAIVDRVLSLCIGVVACAVLVPELGKLFLFSNNGSLYGATKGECFYFSSESFPLTEIGCTDVVQVRDLVVVDVPSSAESFAVEDLNRSRRSLIPPLGKAVGGEERHLEYFRHSLQRCTRCLLPETMPFISFDVSGVCNYCHHYKPRNQPRPQEELFDLVQPYRKPEGIECIVPFSGGRDSCYGLHLIVQELGLRPVTYTYDWGMVTDLGRRNISRMCGAMGVENIIIADDIEKKRRNISKNLRAWLRSPDLGMVSILTAGDKHFFRHVETVKRQVGVNLNLWGVNPLEVTHFKAGFLGVPPDFEERRVYSHGLLKQLRYHSLRVRAMLRSPGYFNSSLWDTLSGEYYRSFTNKSDYYHIFDYWKWDEKTVDSVLEGYNWERAADTSTTWRIGDGTAAFYNYVYYTVAGFTEHDTFRSNQIREGELTRAEALRMVEEENRPRYQNIKWYLDAVGFDFLEVVRVVNAIPKLYEPDGELLFC
jgi:glutamine---fructose-6-phosphate transaminase (isomerizing)